MKERGRVRDRGGERLRYAKKEREREAEEERVSDIQKEAGKGFECIRCIDIEI